MATLRAAKTIKHRQTESVHGDTYQLICQQHPPPKGEAVGRRRGKKGRYPQAGKHVLELEATSQPHTAEKSTS